MLNDLYDKLGNGSVAVIIISISIMLFFGFLLTRLTKLLKLPNVTAYIITGILIGPYCLNLIPQNVISGTDFISDIALAFIAFGVGEFFKLSVLKKNGAKVLIITVFEALMASIIVFIVMFCILRLSLAFSIVLSALAAATAPASTVMTIRQTNAKGDFVDTLLQVVALDDVVSLVAYSIAISVAISSIGGNGANFNTVFLPIIINVGVLILGGLFGVFMKLLMPKKRSTDNKLIISIALLFAFCGICAVLEVSPLLGCMSMGMVYTNITDDDKLFRQLNYFSPPILLLFFVRSGLSFNLTSLISSESSTAGNIPLIVVAVVYFFVRILGKYIGAFSGCLVTKKSKSVRNYLGLALIPQAGVSIGLAALAARLLGDGVGSELQTIILASSVLYEIIGPVSSKLSLYLSKSYSNKIENVADVAPVNVDGTEKTPVQLLTEQIAEIQKQLPVHENYVSEDEKAFNEVADEVVDISYYMRRYKRFKNRR